MVWGRNAEGHISSIVRGEFSDAERGMTGAITAVHADDIVVA